ncbi:succinyl-diaminopimelate desuccinylase [Neoehrlichia mikurensis]|uniref:Succinyl-diaminopimelate desuccinylase n=1 Tax=Neoehrlichia mikurensis TaxID=89586 RepID=A0A9Q9F4N6_9RICK|nr:succinyl-diaminopimelate desuccinylase [Neoehrlichia mikurensis]QXK92251.1 succinyl-diaminopimelate desuccinylase [Neoehrlichia mikurensis]QXK92706.1 succinyl-diaminopimelate desuccinylase [Neoehrlichia mikurensis]QXK93944.1 succinyl-diaminopimelate desuccinylase [Neoehrlichia mikurensis]UTO55893.1 succinyl-diaminopimelate desuccinylase [Neoehrlichia mikurensis]UTO56809.1 succinyl-diaminopimelate desuccinylase [Neoehrlichia mikurensis]
MCNPIALLRKLITFPSITPDNGRTIDFISEVLSNHGFTCNVFNNGNDKIQVKNLYAQLGNTPPNLCFAGHTDVVPAGNLQKWSFNPFSAAIHNDILYGRGVVDMKGAICAFISAAIQHKITNGSISFIITGNEEGTEYEYGTPAILQWMEQNNKKIDFCIVGEPTSNLFVGDTIKIGRRGSITFNLTCYGIQGHVAYPQFAHNAINDIICILHQIKNISLDNGNEYFQPSHCEITDINTENIVTNIIPDSVTAHFNIRFNNQHNAQSIFKIIDNICSSITQRYSLSYKLSAEPFISNNNKYTDTLMSTIKEITNREVILSTCGGTSDARFIKDFCAVAELGLLNKTAHKIDENAPISDILLLFTIYKNFIEKFFLIRDNCTT